MICSGQVLVSSTLSIEPCYNIGHVPIHLLLFLSTSSSGSQFGPKFDTHAWQDSNVLHADEQSSGERLETTGVIDVACSPSIYVEAIVWNGHRREVS